MVLCKTVPAAHRRAFISAAVYWIVQLNRKGLTMKRLAVF